MSPRPLSSQEFTAVAVVAALVVVLAVIGFVNSFTAVAEAARPSFGVFAWTLPIGIDLGIAIFAALDIVLARLNMRIWWLRLFPWALTAATVYLNVAGETSAFGAVAHAILPCLWVVAVEVGAHVIRIRAGIESGTRMDRIRASRWLLAPFRTVVLWRRMVLWEMRSYRDALDRERARLLILTELQDTYGALAWRWKAPRRTRALYRLGELAPAEPDQGGDEDEAPTITVRPDDGPEPDDRPAIAPGPSGPSGAPGLPSASSSDAQETPRPADGRTSKRGRATTRGRNGKRTAPDVDDLMPLGWRITTELESRGLPLNRDTLAAALREADQSVSNERAGVLLARLKAEAPADPTRKDTASVPRSSEGDDAR
ncbi:DUF2637 domain-containing protein [Actinomadura viridis]|uniref:DUF2637 domain-containing protein n=1 Tax=Actinomadura viridis TaxID=58110 RepID=A0A931DQZ0_9ACTN|nr:DUF2637 domain-containing protein [Actinomadura viridis]MBG6092367.1 hypothetical protein [Actinomadura viridis]